MENKLRRSRYGCLVCRKRKKRCDQVRPVCGACVRLKLACQYPEPGTERKNQRRKSSLGNKSSRGLHVSCSGSSGSSSDDSTADYRSQSVEATSSSTNSLATSDLIDVKNGQDKCGVTEYLMSVKSSHKKLVESDPELLNTDLLSVSKDFALSLEQPEVTPVSGFDENPQRMKRESDMGAIVVESVELRSRNRLPSPPPTAVVNGQRESRIQKLLASAAEEQEEEQDVENTNETTHDTHDTVITPTHQVTTTTTYGSPVMPGLSPLSFAFTDFLQDILVSPTESIFNKLDAPGRELFDYFTNRLAKMINVGGADNSFLNVFVPMAYESDSVLYSIVAWAGFHKDKGQHQDVGYRYLSKVTDNVLSVYHKQEYTTIAALLLICAAEICSGDLVHWHKHLGLAAKLMQAKGGIEHFLSDNSLAWLASNFSYHDLLAASTCSRKPHFTPSEYEMLLVHTSSSGPDSLIGCCQQLFHILAEISDLAVQTNEVYNTGVSDLATFRDINCRAQDIERKIEHCIPSHIVDSSLTAEEAELQLTLFEVFQIASKLHLSQSVLHINAAAVPIRYLDAALLQSLDVVLGSQVDGILIFPLFIAGINCCDPVGRQDVLKRFDKLYERGLARNIRRARQLMEEVWLRDNMGNKHIDWYSIIGTRGWDICFA